MRFKAKSATVFAYGADDMVRGTFWDSHVDLNTDLGVTSRQADEVLHYLLGNCPRIASDPGGIQPDVTVESAKYDW